MSYILDALRKSDQQRQRGATPMTLTAQATLVVPRRPVFSANALLAVVLLGAGIVIGWLRPWQQAVPTPEPVAVRPLAASPHHAAPLPVLPEMAEKTEHEAPLPKSTSAAQSAYLSGGKDVYLDAPAPARTEPPHTPSEAIVAKDAATPMPGKSIETHFSEAESEQRVMALGELPESIRKEIPRLSISLHSYASDPKDRLVMINNMMLRQGESLAPGLRLAQITPDGVIISYKKYRFHRGVR